MTIALSHGGPTIHTSMEPSNELLVGTNEGIARLVRDDGAWRAADQTLRDLHIGAILVESDNLALAGGYGSGSLYLSRDGGHNWERFDEGLTETDIYSLASLRRNGRLRLFVGTEPARLFCSDDFGPWNELPELRSVPSVGSWSFPAPPHVAHAKHITFDPRNPSTMYVSIEVGGLLRSDDEGLTWREVPGMYEDVHRLVINPREPEKMYVTGGAGLYASTDSGVTWEHRTDRDHELGGYPDQLVYLPSNPDVMFIASAHKGPGSWRESHYAGARISRSRDGGRTWEVLGGGLPDRMQGNVEAMCLEEAGGTCSIFAATTAGEVWSSNDGGDSWSVIAADLAPISKGGHYRNLQPAHA